MHILSNDDNVIDESDFCSFKHKLSPSHQKLSNIVYILRLLLEGWGTRKLEDEREWEGQRSLKTQFNCGTLNFYGSHTIWCLCLVYPGFRRNREYQLWFLKNTTHAQDIWTAALNKEPSSSTQHSLMSYKQPLFRMLEPPGRSSMWRVGFPTPKVRNNLHSKLKAYTLQNENDNALYCGGMEYIYYCNMIWPTRAHAYTSKL